MSASLHFHFALESPIARSGRKLAGSQHAVPGVCKFTTIAQWSSEESRTTWKCGSGCAFTGQEFRNRSRQSTVGGNDQCQWLWQQTEVNRM